jgi:hypothetical protein
MSTKNEEELQMTEHDKEILEAMKKFRDSANELSRLWSEASSSTERWLDVDYPFEKSFDEVAMEIHKWHEEQTALMNAETTYG